jgi:hypothetical protein
MMTVLEAEHVPYRVHPDSGQVLVPADELGKVRMLLAAKGVTAQLPAGLELMDKNDPLGVSQFVQDVRFRRGLEGELAQSDPDHGRDRLGARAPGDRQVELLRRQRRRQVLGLGGGRGQAGPHAVERTDRRDRQPGLGQRRQPGAGARLAGRPERQLPVLARRPDGRLRRRRPGRCRRQALPGRSARQRQRAARPGARRRQLQGQRDRRRRQRQDRRDPGKIRRSAEGHQRSDARRDGKEPHGAGRAGHAVEPSAGVRRIRRRQPPATAPQPIRTRPRATTAARARTRPPASTPTTARSPRSSARAAA